MKSWDKLPEQLKIEEVRPYYDILKKKVFYRFIKRTFDIFASFILFWILLIPSIIIGICIVCTSKGPMFFLQTRVGRYYKPFKIIKFRSMKVNSEGDRQITCKDDNRITKVGKFIRRTHIDEFPQLINVFIGQMSFVGTRPEVPKYVEHYKNEWKATLLIRPGITSSASYLNKIEEDANDGTEETYCSIQLPNKMASNLLDISKPAVTHELYIILRTVF